MDDVYKVKSYREILNELVNWQMHQLKEKHTLQELKEMQALFERHRQELIKALAEKEKER